MSTWSTPNQKLCLGLFLLCLMVVPTVTMAAWPSTPDVDLSVGDGNGEQVVPHIAVMDNGFSYMGWYTTPTGNYDVALQLISPDGEEVWPHNGILISDEAQDSWVMDWDLIATADGEAVAAIRDIRSGYATVSVTKVTQAGEFVWGEDGIIVSLGSEFFGPPKLAETGDGDVVVVWSGDNSIRMQRIAPDGTLRYAAGGLLLDSAPDRSPSDVKAIASDASDVIVSWLADYSYFADKQVTMNCYAADGLPVWADQLDVFTTGSLPFGHTYLLEADGLGGAIVAWESATGLMLYSFVQRVTADGDVMFADGGVRLSTDDTYSEGYPSVSLDPVTQELQVFYTKVNGNQNRFGLYGQKFSTTGQRLWTPTGAELVPIGTPLINFVKAVRSDAGAMVCWIGNQTTGWAMDTVSAMLVDADAALVWDTQVVASTISNKASLEMGADGQGSVRLLWEDERTGTMDTLAKRLNADGSLGDQIVPNSVYAMAYERSETGITLSWNYDTNRIDGFHVYRSVAAGLPERLTPEPVSSATGRILFHDALVGVQDHVGDLSYQLNPVRDGVELGLGSDLTVPEYVAPTRVLRVHGNFPNPFNPATVIKFDLPEAGAVKLTIYDISGRQVRTLVDEVRGAAMHSVMWDGTNTMGQHVASGVYYYALSTERETVTRAMTLVK